MRLREIPKELSLYIPENLDIDKLLIDNPPKFKHYRDCFVYLLHLIYDIPSRKNELIREFTQFYSPLVQRRVKKYRLYLNYLKENMIIETDNQYIKDIGKSKGYAFCEKFETPIKPITIRKKTLIKSILKYIDLDNTTSKFHESQKSIINKELPHITKWLNKSLTIDFESAENYLMNEYRKDLKNKDTKGLALRKYNSRMIAVHKLNNGDFHYSIDDNAGRLYTVLTQIKKELRQFIRYKGKKLVAVDIKNSQPFLSSVLFSEEHYNLNNCEKTIRYFNPIYRIEKNYSNFKVILNEARKNKDIPKFYSIISEGKIYEYFGTELQNNSVLDKNLTNTETRNRAKKFLVSLMFGENDYNHFSKYAKVLSQVFPTVYEIYYSIKYDKHNTLACFLQNLEANLVLHTACKIISEERPDLPIYTIHDSIVTTEGNEEYIKGVLYNVLDKYIGLPPSLKIEKWENSLVA